MYLTIVRIKMVMFPDLKSFQGIEIKAIIFHICVLVSRQVKFVCEPRRSMFSHLTGIPEILCFENISKFFND